MIRLRNPIRAYERRMKAAARFLCARGWYLADKASTGSLYLRRTDGGWPRARVSHHTRGIKSKVERRRCVSINVSSDNWRQCVRRVAALRKAP